MAEILTRRPEVTPREEHFNDYQIARLSVLGRSEAIPLLVSSMTPGTKYPQSKLFTFMRGNPLVNAWENMGRALPARWCKYTLVPSGIISTTLGENGTTLYSLPADEWGRMSQAWASRMLRFSKSHPQISLSQIGLTEASEKPDQENHRNSNISGALMRLRLLYFLDSIDESIESILKQNITSYFQRNYGNDYQDRHKLNNNLDTQLKSLSKAGIISYESVHNSKRKYEYQLKGIKYQEEYSHTPHLKTLFHQIIEVITPHEGQDAEIDHSQFTLDDVYNALTSKYPKEQLNLVGLRRDIPRVIKDLIKKDLVEKTSTQEDTVSKVSLPRNQRTIIKDFVATIEEFRSNSYDPHFIDSEIVEAYEIVSDPELFSTLLEKARDNSVHIKSWSRSYEETVKRTRYFLRNNPRATINDMQQHYLQRYKELISEGRLNKTLQALEGTPGFVSEIQHGRKVVSIREESLPNELKKIDHPILTKDQVKVLFQYMRTPFSSIHDLFTDQHFIKEMKVKDESAWEQIYDQSKSLTDILVACNYKLIRSVAQYFSRQPLAQSMHIEELLNIGELALRRAAEMFNPNYEYGEGQTVAFSTFIRPQIYANIQQEVMREAEISNKQYLNALQQAYYIINGFQEVFGKKPDLVELRDQLEHNSDITEASIDYVIGYFLKKDALSLDTPFEDNSGSQPITLYERLPTVTTIEADEEGESVHAALANLSEIERIAVIGRFGMNRNKSPLSDDEIALSLRKFYEDIQAEDIDNIVQTALAKIKQDEEVSHLQKGRTGEPQVVFSASTVPINITETAGSGQEPNLSGWQRIRALLLSYRSRAEIAKDLGISKQTIEEIIMTHDTSGYFSDNKVRERRNAQIAVLNLQGVSSPDIAEQLGLNENTIRTILRRNKNMVVESSNSQIKRGESTTKEILKMREWLDSHDFINSFFVS